MRNSYIDIKFISLKKRMSAFSGFSCIEEINPINQIASGLLLKENELILFTISYLMVY